MIQTQDEIVECLDDAMLICHLWDSKTVTNCHCIHWSKKKKCFFEAILWTVPHFNWNISIFHEKWFNSACIWVHCIIIHYKKRNKTKSTILQLCKYSTWMKIHGMWWRLGHKRIRDRKFGNIYEWFKNIIIKYRKKNKTRRNDSEIQKYHFLFKKQK